MLTLGIDCNAMKPLATFLFFSLTCLVCACGSDDDEEPLAPRRASIVFAHEAQISKAVMTEIPGGNAEKVSLIWTAEGDAKIRALGISPDARQVVFSTFNNAAQDARIWSGVLYFFDFESGELSRTLDKTALTTLLNFPSPDAAMEIVGLGWQNDTILIAHIRPRTDFLPFGSANISMRYSITDGEVLELATSGSSAPFAIPFPALPQKTLYSISLEGGIIFVDGQPVSGASGISHFDISFNLED